MRSGLALNHIVPLASGFPDASVAWALLDSSGVALASGIVTPQPGDVSVTIQISASENTLPNGELYQVRDLTWTYATGGETVAGEFRYVLEGRVPFGARHEGVRNKLGLEVSDLKDEDIELMLAYLWFENDFGAANLSTIQSSGTALQKLVITDAIEAFAALRLLPSLPVRIAKSESSGTNEFQRDKIDWLKLEKELEEMVEKARELIDPAASSVALEGNLFVVGTRATELFPDG